MSDPSLQQLAATITPAQASRSPALEWVALRVSGPDAREFLQGQLTMDLTRLGHDQHQLTAWCTAKGRVWTLLRVWPRSDGYGLLVPAALAEAFMRRLQMFVLRAQVTIERNPATVTGGFDPTDQFDRGTAAADDSQTVLHLGGGQQLLIGAAASSNASISVAQWLSLRLLAGEPQIGPSLQEKFLPQALGLAPGQGLDFNKGCYVGQEIVARVHYRGRCPEQLALRLNPRDDDLGGCTILADIAVAEQRLVQIVEPAPKPPA